MTRHQTDNRPNQAQVLQTFDVPEQVAADYAALNVALAEDHGGLGKAAQLDWDYRIKQDGAVKKWRWRSEDERARFEAAQTERYQAYEFLISKRHAYPCAAAHAGGRHQFR